MPAQLPTGAPGLPPLGGRLFAAYRLCWWLLLGLALTAVGLSWIDPAASSEILALRLAKSLVLLIVSALLFRRRKRDPVAAMLSLAFLLWTASSSIDFSAASTFAAVLDRFRFLLFATALLLFPDGKWKPRWTRGLGGMIVATFLLGIAEATGALKTALYLPIAIGCVLGALAALHVRYRALDAGTEKQQLKWVTLGLFGGIALILMGRAGAALTTGMTVPIIGSILVEGLFQLGIIVLALGFLISLLRYRLYDAEAAISRSAVYAALTLALVGTFAAVESGIELISQNYLGGSVGNVSGAVAAAVAAVLLTPLHGKISDWAEGHFQHDLSLLKRDLPDLLLALSGGNSLKRLAMIVLPHIERAVHSTRAALLVDGKLVSTQGVGLAPARRLLRGWKPPESVELIDRNDDDPFPLRLVLRCPLGSVHGWLLLGPRPDGSYYGKDDLDALAEIAPQLQRTLFLVAEREGEDQRTRKLHRETQALLTDLARRVEILEGISDVGAVVS